MGNDEVDDHGGAAGEGGLRPDVKVVHRLRTHERHLRYEWPEKSQIKSLFIPRNESKFLAVNLQVSVGVDAAGDDELAGGVDGAGAAGDPIQVLAHRLDHPETEKDMEWWKRLKRILLASVSIRVKGGAENAVE